MCLTCYLPRVTLMKMIWYMTLSFIGIVFYLFVKNPTCMTKTVLSYQLQSREILIKIVCIFCAFLSFAPRQFLFTVHVIFMFANIKYLKFVIGSEFGFNPISIFYQRVQMLPLFGYKSFEAFEEMKYLKSYLC